MDELMVVKSMVYIVTKNSIDRFSILGAFTTKAKAEKFVSDRKKYLAEANIWKCLLDEHVDGD